MVSPDIRAHLANTELNLPVAEYIGTASAKVSEFLRVPLIGFKFEPNPATDDIEEALGIKFPVKPRRMLASQRNRRALVANAFSPSRLDELFFYGLPAEDEVCYLTPYNIVLSEGESSFGTYHENTHALVHFINPSIYRVINLYDIFLDTVRYGVVKPEAAALETTLVVKCFDEGVADWGAITTGVRMQGQKMTEALSCHNLHLTEITKQHSTIDEGLSILLQLTRETPNAKDRLDVFANTCDMLDDAYYPVGYYFTFEAMKMLVRLGLSTPQALTLLVKNPPTTIQQLKNPVIYARGLI